MALHVGRREFTRIGLLSSAATALPALSWGAAAPAFRLGLVTYNVAKDWDLPTLLRLLREARFEGVELRTTHAHGVERTLTPAQRADVRGRLRDAGLVQTSLGSVCEFHSPDAAVVKRNVDDCREWVTLARDIGARAVKVRPNGLPKEVPEDKTLDQIGRALAECGVFAAEHGVEIWVEVHGEGTKIPSRMRRIMDACGHPSVGVTWNSNDTDVAGGSIAASFELLQPFIRCCHITDIGVSAPAGPSSGPGGAPASGAAASGQPAYPYRELFARLAASGFKGFTLCEYPRPVEAAAGASWLAAYRRRWEELRTPA